MKKNALILFSLSAIALMLTSCDAMLSTYQPNNYPNYGSGQQVDNFSGKYSNQGDVNRASNFTMNLSQSGNHISGTSRNTTGNGNDSGLLSVDGNVDGNIANLQFFDQRGNLIANGVLSHNEDAYSFIQNSKSFFIPAESYLYRGR
ncbi:hypothetical protein HZQ19_13990 [Elizabethkingia anophelis]|uniref:hypothetical protein n=1 Tax=Elizabethkingia anophelis TaxID=1117645 RepID=UPI0009953D97|nr:hypothetical protein [Elizabethkingia anophelis]AQW95019.1 hypothetical protein BBD30_12955 [Elizabethkingia anophelis]MCT3760556.1 hypothetical protein [Elizabethkingia anophelis]MCT3788062.1 hypothetical protein [Elizabethkingia anophelis]MCT3975178.1 hypothetical protein [Elizabethkingia anophelis]MCT4002972.1 hypothetical protein [Elizabethkingia anophelis]